MVPRVEPLSVIKLDTPAGLVAATATCKGSKVVRVTLDMPPACLLVQDATIDTAEWGPLRHDLAFGGVIYELIAVGQGRLTIAQGAARALAVAAVGLHVLIAATEAARHLTTPALNGQSYIMFHAGEPDGGLRAGSMPTTPALTPSGTH